MLTRKQEYELARLKQHDATIIKATCDTYGNLLLAKTCTSCNQEACNGGMVGSIQECQSIKMIRDVCEEVENVIKGGLK